MKNLILGAATILGVYFIWKIGNGKTFNQAVDDLKNINDTKGGSSNSNPNSGAFPPKDVKEPVTKGETEKGILAVNNLGYNEMPYLMNVSPNVLQDYSIDPFDIFTDNKVLTIENS